MSENKRARALVLSAVMTVFAIGAASASTASAQAQGAPAASRPHDLYGDPAHADLSGMWNPDQAGSYVMTAAMAAAVGIPAEIFARMPHPPSPKLTPAYQARFDRDTKSMQDGNPPLDSVSKCLAFGLPRFMTMPMEIIQTPGQLTLNLGVLHDIRRIYIDGRGHTPDVDASFSGDSVGHWEGDTLVVETSALRAGTFDRGGIPFSDKLTVMERFRRTGPNKMEDKMILIDPEAFQEPFQFTRTYTQMPAGSRFEEYICENNKERG
jgi:hypothetical protein